MCGRQRELRHTLILFASDNGGSAEVVRIGSGEIGSITRWSSVKGNWANVSNTPFRKYKNYSHEGGICTPLIVHWPGAVRGKGTFVRTPAHFIDVMATLVDVASAKYPTRFAGREIIPMQGISLTPAFRNEPLRRPQPLFWHWSRGKAIRAGHWKLVAHGKADWELYDMAIDRTETRDLASRHPERVAEMANAWEEWFDSTRRVKP